MKMISAAGAAYIKEGKESLIPSENDLFDKIINLRFIRKGNKQNNYSRRSMTIRSDYEPVFHKDNTISFRKCTQKPDIKISYKQVAESVAIEVDIYVTNYFVADEKTEGNSRVDSADGDPVETCIIQMGYRKQFFDWEKKGTEKLIDTYYDLGDFNPAMDSGGHSGNQISVKILTGYPQSYPPDKVMYFKGIVGTISEGFHWKQESGDKNLLSDNYGDPKFPEKLSEIERVLYQYISRRFIAPDVLHSENEDGMYIYKKSSYQNRTYREMIQQRQRVNLDRKNVESAEAWEKLELLENGLMSVEDTNKFGVVCAVSQTLRDLTASNIRTFGVGEGEKPFNVPTSPYNQLCETVGGQIISIQQHYPFLRVFILMDGSYYFYHVKENDEKLYKDPFIKSNQRMKPLILPAIYDMTPSGTRTIRCPFISFLSPGMTVLFQSQFTISTFVGYYYAPKTNAFLVIISTVNFATVQEDNMMELMCVDLPRKEIKINEQTGEIEIEEEKKNPEASQSAEKQSLRNMEWEKQSLQNTKDPDKPDMRWIKRVKTVSTHRTGYENVEPYWTSIIRYVFFTIRSNRWKKGTLITSKTVLKDLRDWNPELFDPNGKYMKRGNSFENKGKGIGALTGIPVPLLKEGDKIMTYYPYQSEYPPDEEIT